MNQIATQPCISIPEPYFSQLSTSEIQVHAGNRITKATVFKETEKEIPPCKSPFLRINRELARRLFLESNSRLNYKILPGSVLKLGPVVGVITAWPGGKGSPSGKKARLLREMVLTAQRKGICIFIFYPEGVNWEKEIINGYSYREGHWVQQLFPLPDILYNRIKYRKIENQSKIQELLAKLESYPGIFLFNSRFLNKWEVYQALQAREETSALVPETAFFHRETLVNFFYKYDEVFIKPSDSSIGKGITKVVRQGDDRYLFAQSHQKRTQWTRCSSFDDLYKKLARTIWDDQKMIIQKGIKLAKYGNRVFDLRAQVQKDGTGNWVFTGVGVRVAGPGKFVTHVPNGGSIASYSRILREVFGKSEKIQKHLDMQLQYICKMVPRVLENELGITLAILSLDIGIDETNKMLLIEVNSKPSSFNEKAIRRSHLEYLSDFFIFASDMNS